MTGYGAVIADLFRTTLTDPRRGAREVLGLDLPIEARWLAAALTVVLSLILTLILMAATAPDPANPIDAMLRNPVAGAFTQAAMIVGMAFGMSAVARRFGGHASFADGLVLAAWLEFMLFVVQLAMLVVLLVLPFLGVIGGVVSVVLFLWYLTAFTAEANDFQSMPKVLVGVVIGLIVGLFVFVVLLTLLGLAPTLPEAP